MTMKSRGGRSEVGMIEIVGRGEENKWGLFLERVESVPSFVSRQQSVERLVKL